MIARSVFSIASSIFGGSVVFLLLIGLFYLWRYDVQSGARHKEQLSIMQNHWEKTTDKLESEQKRIQAIEQKFLAQEDQQEAEHDQESEDLLHSLYKSQTWSDTDIPDAIFDQLCDAGVVDPSQIHLCSGAREPIKTMQN